MAIPSKLSSLPPSCPVCTAAESTGANFPATSCDVSFFDHSFIFATADCWISRWTSGRMSSRYTCSISNFAYFGRLLSPNFSSWPLFIRATASTHTAHRRAYTSFLAFLSVACRFGERCRTRCATHCDSNFSCEVLFRK